MYKFSLIFMNFEKFYNYNHKSFKYLSGMILIMNFVPFSLYNFIYIKIINIYIISNFSDLLKENYFRNLRANQKNRNNICKYNFNIDIIISQDC